MAFSATSELSLEKSLFYRKKLKFLVSFLFTIGALRNFFSVLLLHVFFLLFSFFFTFFIFVVRGAVQDEHKLQDMSETRNVC